MRDLKEENITSWRVFFLPLKRAWPDTTRVVVNSSTHCPDLSPRIDRDWHNRGVGLLQLIEEQTLRAFPTIAWKGNNTFHTYHSARRWFELVHDVLADADKLLYNQSRLAMSGRISRVSTKAEDQIAALP